MKGIGVRALNEPGRSILRRPTSRRIESVAFDGSGHRLVFSAVPSGGGDFELFSVRVDGGGLKQLTRNEIQDIEPSVSRSGTIVFAQLQESGSPAQALFGRSNLALIRPGRGPARPLTHGPKLIVVYMYIEVDDRVVIIAFHDARTSDAAIALA